MREREPNMFQAPDTGGESRSSAEHELSPEVIEKVMEKVQDIDMPGTAYASMQSGEEKPVSRLENILQQGLWPGGRRIKRDPSSDPSRAKEWKESVRGKYSNYFNVIYFNIVGRSILDSTTYDDNDPKIREINHSPFVRANNQTITFLFDHTFLTEFDYSNEGNYKISPARPEFGERNQTIDFNWNKMNYREFSSDTILQERDEEFEQIIRGKKISPKTSQTYGFVTRSRIAPRRFTGLVVGADFESSAPLFNDLISAETRTAAQTNDTRLLPVYNVEGDLLWPKQMSYEEVKKFVAERDSEKQSE